MKKLIALSLLATVMVLEGGFFAPVHAQNPANDLKPTFISPTPGLYVNGWPAFTVSYPKEWVEMPLPAGAVFRAGMARPDADPNSYQPSMTIVCSATPLPLEDWAKQFMPVYIEYFTDIKVLSDKPSQLKDGTPAREVQLDYVTKSTGRRRNDFILITKKEMVWVQMILATAEEKAGEDLKRIAYSLIFQPAREEPAHVPPDVRAFLDMWCTDTVSHDVKTMMDHFSDRFRHSGMSKAFVERVWRNDPTSPIQRGTISCEATVTVFEPRGDKAYADGFILDKAKGDANAVKFPMTFQQIINEHGEWKWFGNQK